MSGVDINSVVTERIVATVYCSGDYIMEFVTSSPLFMNKTSVAAVSGTTNQYYITLRWIPIADQYGPQVFCAAPIDQRQLTGPQYCINFVVGYRSPELNTPITVQGKHELLVFFAVIVNFCSSQVLHLHWALSSRIIQYLALLVS